LRGPERLAVEWWRAPAEMRHAARDYYRLEDGAGRRFWLYRDGLYQAESRRAGFCTASCLTGPAS